MESWAATVTVRGGSAVTEHGIGKVKSHLFSSIPLPRHMELVLQLKEKLDPDGIWNPGNIKINTPNE
jgi:FAD/FMN-containing dehydrogenase